MAADGHLNFDTKISTSGFEKGIGNIEHLAGGLKSSILKLGAAIGAAFSVKALIEFGKETKKLYDTQIEAEARLEQVLKNTTGATAEQIQSVKDYSSALQELGVIGDEVQLSGLQELGTYIENVDSLKKMNVVLNDMLAQQYGLNATSESAVTIATMLGKVLEGQTGALSRYGYSFDEAQEQLLKFGTEEQRVATLAEVVEQSVGGMNAALANTDAGKMKQVENTIGDIKEQFGQAIYQLEVLFLPALQKIADLLSKAAELANRLSSAIAKVFGSGEQVKLADTAASAADSYENMAEAAEAAQEANEGSLASFDQINKLGDDTTDTSTAGSTDVGGITSGGAVLTLDINTEEADGKFEKWLVKIKNGFESAKQTISNGIAAVRQYASTNFGDIWNKLSESLEQESGELGETFDKIGDDLQTLAEPLKDYFNNDFTPYLRQKFITISDIVTGLYDTFNMVFSDIWDIAVFPILQNFVTTGLPLITQFATQVWETIDTLFNNLKLLFDQYWTDFIAPYIEFAVSVWTDFVTLVKEKWDEYGEPIFEGLRAAIDKTTAVVSEFWTKWLKPIFDYAMEKAREIWDDYLKPLLDNIISLVAELILTVEPIYNDIIAPLISWLVDKLAPVVTWVGKGIVDDVSNRIKIIITLVNHIVTFMRTNLQTVSDDIKARVEAVKSVFKGLTTFLKGVFTGDFSKAWAGIRQIFKGAWDLMVATVKSPINKIIGFINTLIAGAVDGFNALLGALSEVVNAISDAVGSLSFDIPDWVPEYGGMSIGFDLPKWYPGTLEPPEIPKLATGAYIPANYGEFAAILGDNKREAEVVLPISAVKQALLEAMVEYYGAAGNEQQEPIVITLDGKVLGNSMIKFVNGKTKQNGKSPLISVKGV